LPTENASLRRSLSRVRPALFPIEE